MNVFFYNSYKRSILFLEIFFISTFWVSSPHHALSSQIYGFTKNLILNFMFTKEPITYQRYPWTGVVRRLLSLRNSRLNQVNKAAWSRVFLALLFWTNLVRVNKNWRVDGSKSGSVLEDSRINLIANVYTKNADNHRISSRYLKSNLEGVFIEICAQMQFMMQSSRSFLKTWNYFQV